VEQVEMMSKSLNAIEQALPKKYWSAVDKQAEAAANSLQSLAQGPALASLAGRNEGTSVENLRTQLGLAQEARHAVQEASAAKDSGVLESALQRGRAAWSFLQTAAARPPDKGSRFSRPTPLLAAESLGDIRLSQPRK
jgi:hypothetical protein